jgi:carboxypeptidase family protein
MDRRLRLLGFLGLFLFTSSLADAQITTGALTGTVTDESGGVLPGVTISLAGAALIGGTHVQVTDASGTYRFDRLPPGPYEVVFELTGFRKVVRKDIRINATFTATVDVRLEVGALEETVTVTGESPTVDTKSTVQQTVMNQEILEGVPTGRDVWSLAKIIPGVNVNTYDVGGTQGMQASGLSAHGSTGHTLAMDGLAVNWPGGATMLYYDQGMFEEVNYQTSAMPAEVAYGGIYLNMVTKAGGNDWKGDLRYYFANDKTQSSNFDSVSREYNFPGGNPVKTQYDVNATGAGALLRDKVWFFGSFRRWRVDKVWLASFNPDGTNAIDDNMIWNGSGKLTAQLDPNHRLGLLYNYNWKNRYHRRGTSPAFVEEKATSVQRQPGYATQAKYTGVLGGAWVLESTMGLMAGTYPERYQNDVKPTDLRREDTVLSTATGAASSNYENPNYRFQFDNNVSHTLTGLGGLHNLKAGAQFTRLFFREAIRVNGDVRLLYNNGTPFQITAYNTPVIATSYVHQAGFFVQDSWTLARRLTLNLGARVDRATGWIPPQVSPAGRWVPERRVERRDVYKQWLAVWRTGAAFDLFGDGRTALKANWSRYGNIVATGIVTNVHPFSQSSATISWSDRNGNNFPDADELGRFEGFTGGATSRYADPNGTRWPYSDEIAGGIEHQVARDLRLGVMYYHRTNRDNVGTANVAVPQEAYTPATIANPLGGALTFYNLDSAYVGRQDNVRDNFALLDTDYDGIELTAAKRFSQRWQMIFGFTAGKNVGGQSQGEFNDPNNLINQQGRVGNDSTYSTKLSGTYIVPRLDVAVSGSLLRNTGYPRQISYQITRAIYPGLTRSSQTVRLTKNGDDRLPPVMMGDVRFSRPFRLPSGRSFEPQLEIFNITNNDVIVGMINQIGARLGYPSEILAPRIVRFGFALKF